MLEIKNIGDVIDTEILYCNEVLFKDTNFQVTSIISLSYGFTSSPEIQLRIKGNSETKRIIKEAFKDLYYNENMETHYEYSNLFTIFIHHTDIDKLAEFLRDNIDKIRNVVVNSLYNNSNLLHNKNLEKAMKQMNDYISYKFFTQFLS